MSDYLTDLGYSLNPSLYADKSASSTQKAIWSESATKEDGKSNTDLTFEDMLLLMVTQLQNQTIDNQADTNDMMNQLIQMTVMQAITEMSTQVEDLTNANVMSYAASLVGKEVTVGVIDQRTGTLAQEIVGEVTATGTYNGQQVIFMGDKYYPLSSIMAVGTLPEKAVDGTDTTIKPTEPGDETGDDDKVDGGEGTGEEEDGTQNVDNENKGVEETGGNQESQDTEEPKLPVEDEDGTESVGEANGAAAG